MDCGKLFEVRTIVILKLFNNEETIREVSKRISGHNIRYKLIKYRHLGVRKNHLNMQTPTDDDMKNLEFIALDLNVLNTIII